MSSTDVSKDDMALKKLSPDNTFVDVNDLPWANVWIKTNDGNNDPKPIWMVLQYDGGLAVCCKEYRGYLKIGTTAYQDLLEALDLFTSSRLPENMLYVQVVGKKQIEILVDDEKKSRMWNRTENRYVQVLESPIGKKSGERTNPLLAGRGVQSTTVESQEPTSTKRTKSSV